MERLTFDGNFCDIAQCTSTPGGSFCEDGTCSARKVWERLKAYEDTELDPEMCANYKSFEDEAISKGVPFKRIVALMEADRAGRLVVLPCKVGDTIYHISKVRTSHFEDDKIIIDDEGRWKIYEMPFALMHLPYIGKSYFLTREEAKKALEVKDGGIH